MWHRKGVITLLGLAFMVATVATAVACGGGVPQADYDAAKQDLATQEQKAATLQQQLSDKLGEVTKLQQQVTAKEGDVTKLQQQIATKDGDVTSLQSQLRTKESQLAGVVQQLATTEKDAAAMKQKLDEAAKVTTLISAGPVPTPTPRPAPTPPPAGYVAPPPAKPDAAFMDEVIPFAFYVETLATSSVSKYGFASFPACVPNSQFKRGTKLVWRFEVIDTSTGKRVTDQDGAKVEILLPHGEKLTSRYSKRGGTGPWTWSGGWDIPPDYPLGTFDYQLVVTTKDGRTGTFDQDKVALVRAATATSAGIDSRVQIVP